MTSLRQSDIFALGASIYELVFLYCYSFVFFTLLISFILGSPKTFTKKWTRMGGN